MTLLEFLIFALGFACGVLVTVLCYARRIRSRIAATEEAIHKLKEHHAKL